MGLVTVRSYRDPIAAELAKSLLESQGIRAFVFDQYFAGINWLYSLALGGVKVKVDASDLESAREVLRSSEDAGLEATAESGDADACPACGSREIEAAPIQRVSKFASLWLGLPIPLGRHVDRCRSCGHTWKSAPTEPTPIPAETAAAEELVHERANYPVRAILFALIAFVILWYVKRRIANG